LAFGRVGRERRGLLQQGLEVACAETAALGAMTYCADVRVAAGLDAIAPAANKLCPWLLPQRLLEILEYDTVAVCCSLLQSVALCCRL